MSDGDKYKTVFEKVKTFPGPTARGRVLHARAEAYDKIKPRSKGSAGRDSAGVQRDREYYFGGKEEVAAYQKLFQTESTLKKAKDSMSSDMMKRTPKMETPTFGGPNSGLGQVLARGRAAMRDAYKRENPNSKK